MSSVQQICQIATGVLCTILVATLLEECASIGKSTEEVHQDVAWGTWWGWSGAAAVQLDEVGLFSLEHRKLKADLY